MNKTIRNFAVGAGALLTVAVGVPALATTFLGEEFDCATADRDLARVMNEHQVPQSAGIIPILRHLMWMLDAGINMLDTNCRYETNYDEQRASFVNTRNQAKNTCEQMASSQGICTPQRYN